MNRSEILIKQSNKSQSANTSLGFFLLSNLPPQRTAMLYARWNLTRQPEHLAVYLETKESGILFTETGILFNYGKTAVDYKAIREVTARPESSYGVILQTDTSRRSMSCVWNAAFSREDFVALMQELAEASKTSAPEPKQTEAAQSRTELMQTMAQTLQKKETQESVQPDNTPVTISVNTTSDAAETTGITVGNVRNAAVIVEQEMFHTPRGHGFAAEQANNLYDRLTGHDAKLVADDIDPNTGRRIKNGPDRIVDGVQIQTKYCKSGSDCINDCFENGKYKYINKVTNQPMQVEVPSDKYDAAVEAMKRKIANGQVEGVTDPNEAEKIVRKGHFTYQQALNIAKAGTIESITFDAANSAIVSTYSFGISALMSFATSVWNGEDVDVALKNSALSGLKVGGTTFVTGVLSAQLTKSGLNSLMVNSSREVVKVLGPKATHVLATALNGGVNLYGAAAINHLAKIMRGNVITGVVSTVVLSAGDVVNIFRGRISGKQLFKNVTTTAASVAGGTGGYLGGAAIGTMIFPGVGTVIGGLVGSIAAGTIASKASKSILDNFIEDDAEEMVAIIQSEFQVLAEEYLISQKEGEAIADRLSERLTGGTLKDMFAASSHRKFARELMEDLFEAEVKKRKYIKLPTSEQMVKGLREVLEEMADAADTDEALAEV